MSPDHWGDLVKEGFECHKMYWLSETGMHKCSCFLEINPMISGTHPGSLTKWYVMLVDLSYCAHEVKASRNDVDREYKLLFGVSQIQVC